MKAIFGLVCSLLMLPLLASADDAKIQLVVKMDLSTTPATATATLVEQTPGKLKALVDTLTEQKSDQLTVTNSDESVHMTCLTSPVNTSCRFKFTQHFADILMAPEGFVMEKPLQDLSGLDVLKTNPNLEIPFDVVGDNGQRFSLNLGHGKFQASGHASE